MLRIAVREMRLSQWSKNLVVLAGLIFAHQATVASQLGRAWAAVLAFCLLSSAVYVLNDIRDLQADRLHPRKRFRPLASGLLSVKDAWVLVVCLLLGGGAVAVALGRRFLLVVVAYFLLNVAYTLWLKRMVLIDVLSIAVGFVLRAVGGVVALRPEPVISPWLLVSTLFLALFIAVGKRRNELLTLARDASRHRASLADYSPQLLDQMVPVVTGSTIITYALYAVTPGTPGGSAGMVITVPFVLYGVFRYLYLVYRRGEGGAPAEMLLRDRPLQIDVLLWFVTVFLLLYAGGVGQW